MKEHLLKYVSWPTKQYKHKVEIKKSKHDKSFDLDLVRRKMNYLWEEQSFPIVEDIIFL